MCEPPLWIYLQLYFLYDVQELNDKDIDDV